MLVEVCGIEPYSKWNVNLKSRSCMGAILDPARKNIVIYQPRRMMPQLEKYYMGV